MGILLAIGMSIPWTASGENRGERTLDHGTQFDEPQAGAAGQVKGGASTTAPATPAGTPAGNATTPAPAVGTGATAPAVEALKTRFKTLGNPVLSQLASEVGKVTDLTPDKFNAIVDKLPALDADAAKNAQARQALKDVFAINRSFLGDKPEVAVNQVLAQLMVERLGVNDPDAKKAVAKNDQNKAAEEVKNDLDKKLADLQKQVQDLSKLGDLGKNNANDALNDALGDALKGLGQQDQGAGSGSGSGEGSGSGDGGGGSGDGGGKGSGDTGANSPKNSALDGLTRKKDSSSSNIPSALSGDGDKYKSESKPFKLPESKLKTPQIASETKTQTTPTSEPSEFGAGSSFDPSTKATVAAKPGTPLSPIPFSGNAADPGTSLGLQGGAGLLGGASMAAAAAGGSAGLDGAVFASLGRVNVPGGGGGPYNYTRQVEYGTPSSGGAGSFDFENDSDDAVAESPVYGAGRRVAGAPGASGFGITPDSSARGVTGGGGRGAFSAPPVGSPFVRIGRQVSEVCSSGFSSAVGICGRERVASVRVSPAPVGASRAARAQSVSVSAPVAPAAPAEKMPSRRPAGGQRLMPGTVGRPG